MSGSGTAARIVLVLLAALLAASSASSADLDPGPDLPARPDLPRRFDFGIGRVCKTEAIEVEVYPPAPRYMYDNRRGATWTGNGWVYLPVGEHPGEGARAHVAPPPPHGVNPTEFLKIPCSILKHLPDHLPGR